MQEQQTKLKFGEGFKRPRKLTQQKAIPCDGKDVFVVRFDQDDTYIAAGLGSGEVQLYNLEQDKPGHILKACLNDEGTPVTCLRWRPPINKSKYVLVSGNADGSVVHWHAPSGKKLHSFVEENNSVLCMDFNFDGSLFATSGRDFSIRIYDDDIKGLQQMYGPADWSQKGHSNRVFSVKFLPDQPNILISGGWDSNLLIWDIREKTAVAQFYGPSLSGDALDYQVSKGIILSGSYRTEQQIQLWDFRQRKLLQEIKWNGTDSESSKSIYVYSAQYSKISEDNILVGSSGVPEARMFENRREYQPCASVTNFEKGIYSVDFANTQQKFAFGGAQGEVYVIQYA